jgi:hypothetical protein
MRGIACAWDGRCQVSDGGAGEGLKLAGMSCGVLGSGRFTPSAEGGVASGTVLVGGDAMAVELKVVMDTAVSG